MDTVTRLEELAAEFQRRSAEKNPTGGWAEIVYRPAFMGWTPHPRNCRLRECRGETIVRRQAPEAWYIQYRHANGTGAGQGITIGTSRAAAILWLLRHRRDWP